jgi:hypothetical protein
LGSTGVAEYAYRPFGAAPVDAVAVMQPDGDVIERFKKPCNVYPYAPSGCWTPTMSTSPDVTATAEPNAMNTQPVAPGLPACCPSSVSLRHTDTVFVPVSAPTRYHHTPLTRPEHANVTRCAVSTAYCEPSAIVDGGTSASVYSRSPPEPAGVVDDGGIVVEVLVDVVGVVVVVDGPVVVVTGGLSRTKSGVIQYSDSAYVSVGSTGVAEYA